MSSFHVNESRVQILGYTITVTLLYNNWLNTTSAHVATFIELLIQSFVNYQYVLGLDGINADYSEGR